MHRATYFTALLTAQLVGCNDSIHPDIIRNGTANPIPCRIYSTCSNCTADAGLSVYNRHSTQQSVVGQRETAACMDVTNRTTADNNNDDWTSRGHALRIEGAYS